MASKADGYNSIFNIKIIIIYLSVKKLKLSCCHGNKIMGNLNPSPAEQGYIFLEFENSLDPYQLASDEAS